MSGDLSGDLSGTCWVLAGYWLGLGHSYDHPENISLHQFRISTTVSSAVLHHLAHAGAQLISPADLAEKPGNYRILWKRGEVFRVQTAKAVGAAAVFGADLAILDDQLGGEGVGVFPVNQDV